MALGQPFSIRLSEETERLVEDEARRTGRSKSAIVAAFTEETARTQRFAGIGFRGDHPRRRAWVVGSGLDVWEIIQMLEDFGSPETLVAETHLTLPQVHVAVAYHGTYPEEVDEAVRDNRRDPDTLGDLHPFVRRADD